MLKTSEMYARLVARGSLRPANRALLSAILRPGAFPALRRDACLVWVCPSVLARVGRERARLARRAGGRVCALCFCWRFLPDAQKKASFRRVCVWSRRTQQLLRFPACGLCDRRQGVCRGGQCRLVALLVSNALTGPQVHRFQRKKKVNRESNRNSSPIPGRDYMRESQNRSFP